MKTQSAFAIGILVLGAAAAGVLWHPDQEHGQSHTARPLDTVPDSPGPDVLRFPPGAPQLSYLKSEVAEAHPEPLTDALPGRIAYDEDLTARVSAPIAGRVTRIVVDLGETVARGAPLAYLEAPDFSQATADLNRDELELKRARQAFDRARLLYDGGVMPRKEFESAEIGLREAEVELARAKRRLEALGQSGGGTDGVFVLKAPVSGVITERSINPGTQVGPDSANPLFVISDPRHLRVVVEVPEQQIGALAKGQMAGVEVDAYPGRTFQAEVVHVGDVLDASTRRVQVRARIDNDDRLLKPEMYARVVPLASAEAHRVRIPNASLVTAGVKNYVFVEHSPGEFVHRLVTLSAQGRDYTFLKGGVAPGERVVTSGALLLQSELQGR